MGQHDHVISISRMAWPFYHRDTLNKARNCYAHILKNVILSEREQTVKKGRQLSHNCNGNMTHHAYIIEAFSSVALKVKTL